MNSGSFSQLRTCFGQHECFNTQQFLGTQYLKDKKTDTIQITVVERTICSVILIKYLIS